MNKNWKFRFPSRVIKFQIYLSECWSEGTQISHSSGRDQDVSCQVVVLDTQLSGVLTPSVPLTPKSADQLLGSLQLLGAEVHLGLQVCLLLLVVFQCFLEFGQLVLDFTQGGSLLLQERHGHCQLRLSLLQLFFLGCDNLRNSVNLKKKHSLVNIHY